MSNLEQNKSAAEVSKLYMMKLNQHEPSYYAQMPGCVYHCTYVIKETNKNNPDYGKLVRKKLSTTAIALYGLIKQIAGTKSAVWTGQRKLAEILDKSLGSINAAMKELCQPLEQLNGKRLIDISRKTKSMGENGKDGKTQYHEIVPTHIWPENNAYMATLRHQTKLALGPVDDATEACSIIEHPNQARSIIEHASLGARSIIERNNNTDSNNPSVGLTEPTADAGSVCHHPDKKSVENDDDLAMREETQQTDRVRLMMVNFGCDHNFIEEALGKYTPRRIMAAGHYTGMMTKRQNIKNPLGYLRRAIEKGLQWKQ